MVAMPYVDVLCMLYMTPEERYDAVNMGDNGAECRVTPSLSTANIPRICDATPCLSWCRTANHAWMHAKLRIITCCHHHTNQIISISFPFHLNLALSCLFVIVEYNGVAVTSVSVGWRVNDRWKLKRA
jgi:hypothetical protein